MIDKTSMQGDRLNGIAISQKVFEQSKDRDTVQSLLIPEYLTGLGCFNVRRKIPFLPFFCLDNFNCFISIASPVDRWRNGSAFDSSDAAIERLSVQIRCGSSSLHFLEILKSVSIWDESQGRMMTTLFIQRD